MKKVNRRDYLIQMGAGAAGFIGAALLPTGENSGLLSATALGQSRTRKTRRGRRTQKTMKAEPWPWTTSQPGDDNRGVRLVFSGLMLFTYNGPEAQVAFHRETGHHKLRVVVVETNAAAPCKEIFNSESAHVNINKTIEVRSNQATSDAVFYRSSDPDDFNRALWNPKDFRWLLDIEGPECHDKKLQRIDTQFRTLLRVNTGTFYTYQRTNSTFTANIGTLYGKEFKVAKVIAADIPLVGTKCVSLWIDGTDVLAGRSMCAGSTYEIYFFNDCPTCNTNDFSKVFDALVNGASYRFELALVKKGHDEPAQGLCLDAGMKATSHKQSKLRQIDTKGTDEAPCMGGGAGGGGGFP